MLWSDHSGHRSRTNLRASSTSPWKVRSSRFGASSMSEHSAVQCRNMLGNNLFGLIGNDIEREDEVALIVVAADHVDHVDVERAQFDLIEADANVFDVDARLPPVESGAHVARDRRRRSR